jgi:hypothetical protein
MPAWIAICLRHACRGRPRFLHAQRLHRYQRQPIQNDPVVDDPGVEADGSVDADGHCLGSIEIFGGARALPSGGLLTTFQNCCKDRGKIIKDGMGGSISSISTKIAIAKGVFTGMKAAYAAFRWARQPARPPAQARMRSSSGSIRPPSPSALPSIS